MLKRRLSMEGLRKIVDFKQLEHLDDEDTHIQEIYASSPDTLSLVVHIKERRAHTHVYEILGIHHWANYTTKPVFVTYNGPRYIIHNTENQCTRSIDKPLQRSVYEQCPTDSYLDPSPMKWTPLVASDEEVKSRTKPIIIRLSDHNIVYCLYYKITAYGKERACPPRPFKLPYGVPFNMTDIDYKVTTEHLSRKDHALNMIKTPMLHNMSDNEWDTEFTMLTNLKKK